MKKLFLLMLLMPLISFAQVDTSGFELPYKDGRVLYESIKDVPGASKNKLFSLTKKWVVALFQNPELVIQSEDEPSGQIIGKATTAVSTFITVKSKLKGDAYYRLAFNFSIECKDYKYRIRFYDIEKQGIGLNLVQSDTMPIERFDDFQVEKIKNNKWNEMKKETNKHFFTFINSFSTTIDKGIKDDF